MASYADQLRERLAQISGNAEALTTWEQLKRARQKQQEASMQAIQAMNAQRDAYNTQLANYAQMYNSGSIKKSTTSSGKKKKSTQNGSLGDSFSDIGNTFRGLFQ